MDFAQPGVRGEQHEGAAAGAVENLFDQRRGAAGEIRALGVQRRRRNVQPRLAAIIERRGRDQLLGLVDPERRAQKCERTTGRDRRAGEDDAARAREQRRAQVIGNLERRGVDLVARIPFAPFDPGDRVDLVGRERAGLRLQRGTLDAVDGGDVRADRAQRQIAPALEQIAHELAGSVGIGQATLGHGRSVLVEEEPVEASDGEYLPISNGGVVRGSRRVPAGRSSP